MYFLAVFALIAAPACIAAQRQVCCSGDLGCFNASGIFTNFPNRPIPSLPNCDLVSALKLHVNTRANPVATQIVDPYDIQTIRDSTFSTSRDTKILIHGFTDKFTWPWWTDMIAALLGDGDFNIIRLDWSAGNRAPYLQATANTRLAGAYVAKLCNVLQAELGYSPARIHIIGHSLGAHISGYAGERVDKIGRITGIDPAGLYFAYMDPAVRLDPTDAVIVDTLIADGEPILSLGFGSLQAMGHINFYVNGGNKQPGCSAFLTLSGGPTSFNDTNFDIVSGGVQTFYQTIGCNHWRALSVYTETIGQHKWLSKAYQCKSYEAFLQGQCFSAQNGGSSNLGYQVDLTLAEPNEVKNFYLSTLGRPPFCVHSYRLKLKLKVKTNQENVREERGKIHINVLGSLASTGTIAVSAENVDLLPGADLSFLFTTSKDLGQITGVIISWDAKYNVLSPTDWMRKHYLFVDGNLELQDENGNVVSLQPAQQRIEEDKEVLSLPVVSLDGPFDL